jgi:hypothetical protein
MVMLPYTIPPRHPLPPSHPTRRRPPTLPPLITLRSAQSFFRTAARTGVGAAAGTGDARGGGAPFSSSSADGLSGDSTSSSIDRRPSPQARAGASLLGCWREDALALLLQGPLLLLQGPRRPPMRQGVLWVPAGVRVRLQ